MADSASGETWWGSWIQTAKEKSLSAYEQVKKDLGEYSSTVHCDTVNVVSSTGSTLKDTIQKENSKLKQGLTSFIGELSNVVSNQPRTKQGQSQGVDSDVVFDRAKVRMHAIQIDPSTYLDQPQGKPEHYTMWEESFDADGHKGEISELLVSNAEVRSLYTKMCYTMWEESFDADGHKGEISELLVSNAEVRSLYTKMVPGSMSHGTFWRRYFYRIHQLNIEDIRKQALMKWAEEKRDDDYSWDDDDESFVDVAEEIKGDNPSPQHKPRVTSHGDDRLSGTDSQRPEPTTKIPNRTDDNVDSTPIDSVSERLSAPETSNTLTDNTTQNTERDLTKNTDTKPNISPDTDAISPDTQPVQETINDTQDSSHKNTDVNIVKTDDIQNPIVETVPRDIPCVESVETQEVDVQSTVDVKSTVEVPPKVDMTPKVETTSAVETPEVKATDTIEIRSKVKGDMVVVGGSSSSSPSSGHSSNNKDTGSVDDDWEDDLDLEVTEEDIKAAEEVAKQLTAAGVASDDEDEDDWNWD